MKTVLVCGGGASGMMAALTAAENRNNRVILLERQARVGRKLLATGNGRCNLTNTLTGIENYHGEDPLFAKSALTAFPPEAVIAYFRSLGLVCTEQYGGRVYPLTDAAGSVLDVLRFALDASGAELHTGETVSQISRKAGRFQVISEKAAYDADAVIIACGGRAGGKLGGVSDGYELLTAFGHRRTALRPALAPVFTAPEIPRSLKGVRADAFVTLIRDGNSILSRRGEVQFVEKGVSGPAVFDLTREAAKGGELALDLLCDLDGQEVMRMLKQRKTLSPNGENAIAFAGMLHSRLSLAIVKAAGLRPSGLLAELTEQEISLLAATAKHLLLPITGTDSFENAQVTAGGADTAQFDPETLESRLVPGLFACGEVLDIDGDCGGYNLQWAWSSGRLAGRLGR